MAGEAEVQVSEEAVREAMERQSSWPKFSMIPNQLPLFDVRG